MNDKPKANIIDNEVKKLFKENAHHISSTAMFKLREKYGDEDLLDQIQDAFIDRSREVRKRAKKFAKLISERYSTQNYPLHILLKKALKYKKKYNLSDGEFEEFRRVYEQALTGKEDPQHVSLTVPFTNMSRALGQGMIDADDGMKFDDRDFEILQQLMRLYNETKSTHAQVVLQSMTYQDLAQQSLNGEYIRERHNPHCHVHPVVAALFLPKIDLFDQNMLHANIAYIVKQRYKKQPILTSTDYTLFYDLISDPTDVVCSSDSAVKDLYHRAQLQCHLWNSVISLRNGRYYDCNTTNFKIAIDNCRRSVNDNPDLMYEDDEGTVLQRLLGAFSIRPTIVATSPLYNTLGNNTLMTQHVMPKVTSMPYVTLKIPPLKSSVVDVQLKLEDALNMSQWYVEDGNVVPRNQSIIYSKGVLIFFVPRRAHTLNIGQLVAPMQAQFNRLPRTVAGFDRLNDTHVEFENSLSLGNGDHEYNLKSVVVVEINDMISDTITGDGSKLITGCSTCVRRDTNSDYSPDRIYWYNPLGAAIGHVPPASIQNSQGTAPASINPEELVYSDKPITFIGEKGTSYRESFYEKASTRGTIFIYKKEGESTLQQLITY